MAEKHPTEVLERDGEGGWEDPSIPPEPTQSEAFTASGSEFATDTQVHVEQGRKGTRGGKPARFNPAAGVPEPKFRKFKSDATDPHQRTKSFYNYWNGLPDWARENTLCYVYREHPVLIWIDRDKEDKSPSQEFNYIDKISGTEPLQDDADLLNRYGCGNYKLTFNAIIAGQANRTLCNVYAVNLGGGDYRSNPPTDQRIVDSKNVDLDHPSNKAYVAYLRGVGLLPSQIDAIKGEQEMATVQVLKEQQATTDKLVDTVVKMATDKSERKGDNSDVLEKAMTGAMDIMAKGSEAAIKVTQEANAYASRVREEADAKRVANSPVAADPLTLALKIVELMRGGATSGDAEVVALRAQIDKLRDDQVAMMREELRSLREKPASTNNPFDNIEAGLTAIKKMREMTEEISGSGDKGNVVEDVADAAGAPKWLVRFSPLIQQGLSIIDGFIRMRAGQNIPPGQFPPQAPGYPQNPQNFPQATGMAPQPWAPQPPQAPGPQLVQARHPLATLDPEQFTPELTQLLSAIAIPLGAHLAEDINGTAFADWFMSGFGEGTHTQIVGFGPEGVIAALYSFPPTLQAVQGFPVEKVQEFVTEFLNPQFEDDTTPDEPGSAIETEKTPA